MRRRLVPFAFVALVALLPIVRPFVANEIFVFRDHYDYFAPLRHFTAEVLRSGHLPLWNPYNGSGERWLANPQTGVFYPPTWVFLAVPFARAYLLFLAIHLMALAVGSYALFRRWVSTQSALIGSVLVTLGGPTLSLLDVNNNLASFAWFPWLVDAALDLRDGRPLARIRSVLFLALTFLGGEPMLAAVGWAVFAAIALSGKRFAPRAIKTVAGIALVSMLLVAVQLFPFLEMTGGSDRISGLPASVAFANSLHPSDWLSIAVAPRAPGTTFVFLETSQTYLLSLYLGGFALLGLMALLLSAREVSARIRKVAGVSLVLLSIVVLLAAGRFLPPLAELMTAADLNVSRYPARFAPFGAFALVLLATLGLDRLEDLDGRRRAVLIIATAVAAFLTYVWFFPSVQRSSFSVLAAIGSTAMILTVFAGAPRLLRIEGWGYALALVAAVDLLSAASPLLISAPWDPTSPYERILDQRSKLIRLPDSSPSTGGGQAAPFEREQWLSGYLNLYLRQFDASTSAPVLSDDYVRLHDAALYRPRFDLLDFLSAEYLLTSRPLAPAGYRKADMVGNVHIYRSERSLPMISLWVAARTASTAEEALSTVLARGFDARREIVITGRAEREPPPPAGGEPLRARIFRSEISPRGVVLDVYTSRPILLSVNQLDAPGWRIELNGSEAPGLLANGMFRAVRLPAGTHHVVWSYHSRALEMGAILSCLAVAFLALEGARLMRKREDGKTFHEARG